MKQRANPRRWARGWLAAEQISEALTQLSSAVQQTVESLHQSSVAIENLQRVSAGLSVNFSRFKAQVA